MYPIRVVQSAFRWIPAMATVSVVSALAADLTFNQDIRPILSDNCFSCHGLDAKKRKAGLRLDTAEGAFTANKEGRVAIRPGDLKSSELWQRLETQDPESIMPPPESHKTISAVQKELLRRWIQQGAPYQKHWAFESPRRPAIPIEPLADTGSIDAGSRHGKSSGRERKVEQPVGFGVGAAEPVNCGRG
jgi:hypothetical protein